MARIVVFISSVFSACLNWFYDLLFASGAVEIFLAAVGIFMIYRFLLSPLFTGAGSSDKADKKQKTKKR